MSKEKLQTNNSTIIIEPDSGQMISWTIGDKNVFYIGSSDKRSGIPILFPFADPLKDGKLNISNKKIPQHGFGRNTKWRVTSVEDSKITIEINHQDIDSQSQLAYPFRFVCQQTFELQENILELKILVKNTDTVDIPIAPGIHPYFPIKHSNKSKIKLSNGFDGSQYDWESESNGLFTEFQTINTIDLVDFRIQICEVSESKSFKHLVIWSQTPDNPDFDFVCIEPFTRQTNGINTDSIIVKPNQTWSSKIQFKLSVIDSTE